MRILYQPSRDNPGWFRFLVQPKRGRTLSAPGLELEGVAAIEGGRVVIKQLVVEHADDVTTATLRELPLGELRRQLHRDVQEYPDLLDWATGPVVRDDPANPFSYRRTTPQERAAARKRARRLAAQVARESSQGRKPLDDRFLENVARLYLACYKENPRAASHTLAELMRKTRPGLKDATVRDYVRRAREAGWLARVGQGERAAAPGPKMIDKDTRGEGG